ncbi:MAG: FMN-binding protein [Firmicutes bacterium]|nr:FMN-binding protein [Bacillota bacterium]
MRKPLFAFLLVIVLALGVWAYIDVQSVPSGALYRDGVYTGTGRGLFGPLQVEVAVSKGNIASVKVLEHQETPGISDPAIEQVPSAIAARGSLDVDLVSGATFTSKGIIDAARDALGKAKNYRDGTYTGEARGHNAPLKVEVTVAGGKIAEVKVTEHEETPLLSDAAIKQVPEAIAASGSLDVELVSGASVSSKGIINAVKNAIAKAQLYRDGTYTGEARGHNAPLKVEVTVVGGKIGEVKVTEHEETPLLSDAAIKQIPEAIVASGSLDVDLVSGASVSSKGIIKAVADALKKAE